MKKEVKTLRKLLWIENRKIFDDINRALINSDLDEKYYEDTIEDIIRMILEAQKRNEFVSNIIGNDIKAFVNGIIQGGRRKTLLDKILKFLNLLINLLIGTILAFLFIEPMISNYHVIKTNGIFKFEVLIGVIISINLLALISSNIISFMNRKIFSRKYILIISVILTLIFQSIMMNYNKIIENNNLFIEFDVRILLIILIFNNIFYKIYKKKKMKQ